jgi:hypothetical protein
MCLVIHLHGGGLLWNEGFERHMPYKNPKKWPSLPPLGFSNWYFFFTTAQQPLVVQGLPIIKGSKSHSDTPHSVGLLWTSDQPDAETSTWQHTTQQTDFHALGGIRTPNPSKRAAAVPRLRPRGHWDLVTSINLCIKRVTFRVRIIMF